ncbi:hypothetical protein QBC38DRAFT_504883 [Podospora fimiseda]|uniref:F-box domain-containing protein n=1 Tax=Podospora fimiseda TaxID=252190 RepID=A0AAN7BD78_9PEZI|nr:hypothetical protein QBC38DRAFT_504883 [Podospora fimiseda]
MPRARQGLRSTKTGRIQKPSTTTTTTTSRNLRPRKPSTNPPPKKKESKPIPTYLQLAHIPPTTSRLLDYLPLTLLEHIQSLLPPHSQICLTLTCKRALKLLGTSSWSTCRPRRHGRLSFEEHSQDLLVRADRDTLIQYLSSDVVSKGEGALTACAHCDIYHPPLKPPQTHRITKYTAKCFGPKGTIDYLPFAAGYKTGYSLVWDHIRHVIETIPQAPQEEEKKDISYLSGEFETLYPLKIVYNLCTSAYRLNQNLILKHQHKFRALNNRHAILPWEVLNLPLRICPHQSTVSRGPPHKPDMRRKGGEDLNSPLFTLTILNAFSGDNTGYLKNKEFKKLTAGEQKDLEDSAAQGHVFQCRSCPTRWKVSHDDRKGELVVTAWHCFYEDILSAAKVWTCLVRREVFNLGKNTRNSEWWNKKQSFRDFQIE